MNTIFGYTWEAIQRAQQGGRLNDSLPRERTATVPCWRCAKLFRLPASAFDNKADPWPIQCAHCGYAHTYNDAKSAQWPCTL